MYPKLFPLLLHIFYLNILRDNIITTKIMLTIKSQSVIYLRLELSLTLLPMLFPDGVPCCKNTENILSDRTYMILAQTHIINNTYIYMMMMMITLNTIIIQTILILITMITIIATII